MESNIFDIRLSDYNCGTYWPEATNAIANFLSNTTVREKINLAKTYTDPWTECNLILAASFRKQLSPASSTLFPWVLDYMPMLLFAYLDLLIYLTKVESMI